MRLFEFEWCAAVVRVNFQPVVKQKGFTCFNGHLNGLLMIRLQHPPWDWHCEAASGIERWRLTQTRAGWQVLTGKLGRSKLSELRTHFRSLQTTDLKEGATNVTSEGTHHQAWIRIFESDAAVSVINVTLRQMRNFICMLGPLGFEICMPPKQKRDIYLTCHIYRSKFPKMHPIDLIIPSREIKLNCITIIFLYYTHTHKNAHFEMVHTLETSWLNPEFTQ